MAWISIQLNLGLTLGPLLGGIIYDRVGWYGTFALGFGFLGLDILLPIIVIEKHIAAQYRSNEGKGVPVVEEDGKGISTPSRGSRIPEVIRLLQYPRLLHSLKQLFYLLLTLCYPCISMNYLVGLHFKQVCVSRTFY